MSAAAAAAEAWGEGEPAPGTVKADDEAELLATIAQLQQTADIGDQEIEVQATYEADAARLQLRRVRDLARLKMERIKKALGERKK